MLDKNASELSILLAAASGGGAPCVMEAAEQIGEPGVENGADHPRQGSAQTREELFYGIDCTAGG